MEWARILFICYFLCVTVIRTTKTNQSEPSERIAGGVTATPNEFPWMVYLMLRNGGLTRAACAGTLINRQWILTDSYCVNPNFNQFVNSFKLKINSFFKNANYVTELTISSFILALMTFPLNRNRIELTTRQQHSCDIPQLI